ncbi:cell division protein FtsB [Halofilum ochraceum]|uniref:cell division protein FtsB n=1 Tax=Halofilum ochraceum TaxID=1611323 RepID=UPI0008D9B83F|nr:cell division protein FtsB [Halofilum ochraceum]
MKVLIAVLVALLLTLQYRLWFADGGLAEVHRLQKEIAKQEEHNARLRERNQALAAEVRDLKKGMEAVEARARSELGMVGEGETFFRVIEKTDNDVEPLPDAGSDGSPDSAPKKDSPALDTDRP